MTQGAFRASAYSLFGGGHREQTHQMVLGDKRL